jgi:hypothetical protein
LRRYIEAVLSQLLNILSEVGCCKSKPIQTVLATPGFGALKAKYHVLLLSFAFNFNVRL